MRTLVPIALVVLLNGCSTLTAPFHSNGPAAVQAHSPNDPRFEVRGTWEGSLKSYNAPNFVDVAGSIHFRFVVSLWRVRVFSTVKGAWQEMKPGQFRMQNAGPHALIYSADSGADQGSVWVESSTFTLAHTSPDEIVVYWQRTVNNVDVSPTDEWYQFAWGFSGTVRRVSDGG